MKKVRSQAAHTNRLKSSFQSYFVLFTWQIAQDNSGKTNCHILLLFQTRLEKYKVYDVDTAMEKTHSHINRNHWAIWQFFFLWNGESIIQTLPNKNFSKSAGVFYDCMKWTFKFILNLLLTGLNFIKIQILYWTAFY
jgi:hypothetical protein